MKYFINVELTTKTLTIHLLTFLYFGYRISNRKSGDYLKICIGLFRAQISLVFYLRSK